MDEHGAVPIMGIHVGEYPFVFHTSLEPVTISHHGCCVVRDDTPVFGYASLSSVPGSVIAHPDALNAIGRHQGR